MIQFTPEQVKQYHSRLHQDNSIINSLQQQVKPLLERPIQVPRQGIATWQLYYFCPEHSVQLRFDLDKPRQHVCPVDGAIYTGQPYDGAWWRFLNDVYAQGCYTFGLLWVLTQEQLYLERAKAILLEYAHYYPDYQIHGGIPYNGPGKANAQTLCEAIWLRSLSCGYDLISDQLNRTEKATITTRLLAPGAEFLKDYRTPQIHNHEVIIGATIGILGIILERVDLIDFAINSDYGLIYQLDHAVLEDDFWFEGSLHYHIFALESFLAYEKFALHTPYRLGHPKLPKMLQFPLRLLQPDYELPLLNDAIYGEKHHRFETVYEFGYREYGCPEFAWFLHRIYRGQNRDRNLEAFLYGVADLPGITQPQLRNYHDVSGSGITIFHGKDERYLLVKHSPFGGEHDHYDRLGISFFAFGERIAPDLGTTGYGARLHYEYYKNTGSHNTVMINEANQPPANAKVLRFREGPEYTLLDTEVRWDGSYPGLDSFIIPQWDPSSYAGVTLRRVILWCEEYFIECFSVTGVKAGPIDWVLHVPGRSLTAQTLEYSGVFSTQKPFKYLTNVRLAPQAPMIVSGWEMANCRFNLYSFCFNDNQVYLAEGPDNPSVKKLSYLINRVQGGQAVFVNVFETTRPGAPGIENVQCRIAEKRAEIAIRRLGKTLYYPIVFG